MPRPVSKSPLLPLQKALYELLSEGIDTPVFDFPKEGTPYPYVVLGECTERPANAHDRYGSTTSHTFHVTVENDGFLTALEIVDEISEVVDHQVMSLAVVGHKVVSVRREMTQTLRDPDPKYRHALVRYTIDTEQDMAVGP